MFCNHPNTNPINHFGPLSVSGMINGNAGLGVPNSPAKTAAASQILNFIVGPETKTAEAGGSPASDWALLKRGGTPSPNR